jgi:SAM-dependent methyltransferase
MLQMPPHKNRKKIQMHRNAQEAYYLDKMRQYGIDSALSVGWTDYLQVLLFEKISALLRGVDSGEYCTLLDVGCGLGDYLRYLGDHGYRGIDYTGIDIIPLMIQMAGKKYPGKKFFVADFSDDSFAKEYDYIVCSGALNIIAEKSIEEHNVFIQKFIRKMYDLSRKGCAFNLLCRDGMEFFPSDKRFFYADRNTVMEYCRSFAKDVSLCHDVKEFTFTIVMKQE